MPRYEVRIHNDVESAQVQLVGGPRVVELDCETRDEVDAALAFLRQIAAGLNGDETEPHVTGPDGCS